MHRPVFIAVLAAAVLVPGLQAQMRSGGGRGYSGGSGRVSSGFAAGRGAMPAGRHFAGAPGSHGGAGFRGGAWSHGGGNWVRGTGSFHGGAWSHGGGNRFFHHRHGFRGFVPGCFNGFCGNACFNGFCNFGFSGLPAYYVPPIWPTFDYGPDYGMQAYAPAPAPAAYPSPDTSALQVQIQQLTDEVEQLRDEQREHARAQQPAAPARPSRMDLPTVLVFRDGRVKEVQNYGIVGQTLWILDEQRAHKVPLSELDLVATRNANEDRGGFVVPAEPVRHY